VGYHTNAECEDSTFDHGAIQRQSDERMSFCTGIEDCRTQLDTGLFCHTQHPSGSAVISIDDQNLAFARASRNSFVRGNGATFSRRSMP
jgi:hypothetical protein